MKECHEEKGALASYLAKKEQLQRSKDMLDNNLPTTMNTRFMCIPRNRNYHYEDGLS